MSAGKGLQAAADGEFIPAVGYESMDVNVIDCLVLTGLRAPEDGPLKLNRHTLGTWSLATLSDLLKVYVEGIQQYLKRINQGGKLAMNAAFKLQGLLNELTALGTCLAAWQPRLLMAGPSDGASGATPSLLGDLQLTGDQKQQLIKKHNQYLFMSESIPSSPCSKEGKDGGPLLESPSFKEARQLRSIYHQTRCVFNFTNYCLTQVLSLEQAATTFLKSFPRYPDLLSLVDEIVAAEPQPRLPRASNPQAQRRNGSPSEREGQAGIDPGHLYTGSTPTARFQWHGNTAMPAHSRSASANFLGTSIAAAFRAGTPQRAGHASEACAEGTDKEGIGSKGLQAAEKELARSLKCRPRDSPVIGAPSTPVSLDRTGSAHLRCRTSRSHKHTLSADDLPEWPATAPSHAAALLSSAQSPGQAHVRLQRDSIDKEAGGAQKSPLSTLSPFAWSTPVCRVGTRSNGSSTSSEGGRAGGRPISCPRARVQRTRAHPVNMVQYRPSSAGAPATLSPGASAPGSSAKSERVLSDSPARHPRPVQEGRPHAVQEDQCWPPQEPGVFLCGTLSGQLPEVLQQYHRSHWSTRAFHMAPAAVLGRAQHLEVPPETPSSRLSQYSSSLGTAKGPGFWPPDLSTNTPGSRPAQPHSLAARASHVVADGPDLPVFDLPGPLYAGSRGSPRDPLAPGLLWQRPGEEAFGGPATLELEETKASYAGPDMHSRRELSRQRAVAWCVDSACSPSPPSTDQALMDLEELELVSGQTGAPTGLWTQQELQELRRASARASEGASARLALLASQSQRQQELQRVQERAPAGPRLPPLPDRAQRLPVFAEYGAADEVQLSSQRSTSLPELELWRGVGVCDIAAVFESVPLAGGLHQQGPPARRVSLLSWQEPCRGAGTAPQASPREQGAWDRPVCGRSAVPQPCNEGGFLGMDLTCGERHDLEVVAEVSRATVMTGEAETRFYHQAGVPAKLRYRRNSSDNFAAGARRGYRSNGALAMSHAELSLRDLRRILQMKRLDPNHDVNDA